MESELFLSHFHHTSDLLDKFCSTVILLDFCNILNYNFDKTILQIHIFAFLLGMELVLFLYYFHHIRALLDKFCSEMILSECCNTITTIWTIPSPKFILICPFWAWNWCFSAVAFITPMTFWTNCAVKWSLLITVISKTTTQTERFSKFGLICSL